MKKIILSLTLSLISSLSFAQDATLLTKAEQGDPEAQLIIGSMYLVGKGVEVNYEEAAKWLSLAAKQGNLNAQYNLGVMYMNGEGVNQNYLEAARLFSLPAEKGYANSQYNLGLIHLYGGWGLQQDYLIAEKWFSLAAEQNHAMAQYNLAVMHVNGDGVQKNIDTAKKLFKEACDNDLEEGCRNYRTIMSGQY